MTREENGRVRLSWAQIVWGIAMLIGGLGSWYSLSAKIDLAIQEFHLFVQADREDRDRLWQSVQALQATQAQAAEPPKPKPRRP